MGFISLSQLGVLAETMRKNDYGQYLMRLVEEESRARMEGDLAEE
jgi:glucose-1-phosphate thymidylyltransferase